MNADTELIIRAIVDLGASLCHEMLDLEHRLRDEMSARFAMVDQRFAAIDRRFTDFELHVNEQLGAIGDELEAIWQELAARRPENKRH